MPHSLLSPWSSLTSYVLPGYLSTLFSAQPLSSQWQQVSGTSNTSIQIQPQSLPGCMTLDKSLSFSKLQDVTNNGTLPLQGCIGGTNESKRKCWKQDEA